LLYARALVAIDGDDLEAAVALLTMAASQFETVGYALDEIRVLLASARALTLAGRETEAQVASARAASLAITTLKPSSAGARCPPASVKVCTSTELGNGVQSGALDAMAMLTGILPGVPASERSLDATGAVLDTGVVVTSWMQLVPVATLIVWTTPSWRNAVPFALTTACALAWVCGQHPDHPESPPGTRLPGRCRPRSRLPPS
jgi:hypothetical protein